MKVFLIVFSRNSQVSLNKTLNAREDSCIFLSKTPEYPPFESKLERDSHVVCSRLIVWLAIIQLRLQPKLDQHDPIDLALKALQPPIVFLFSDASR